MRNFFRFLKYKGITIDPAILTLPMTSANWKGRNIPVTLKQEEEQKLRNYEFADNELGARNQMILLLMLDLGLRCSEIPGIRLGHMSHCSELPEGKYCLNLLLHMPFGLSGIPSKPHLKDIPMYDYMIADILLHVIPF